MLLFFEKKTLLLLIIISRLSSSIIEYNILPLNIVSNNCHATSTSYHHRESNNPIQHFIPSNAASAVAVVEFLLAINTMEKGADTDSNEIEELKYSDPHKSDYDDLSRKQQKLRQKYGHHDNFKTLSTHKTSLKNIIADSCGNIEQHITQWLEKVREDFKRRHVFCATKKNNLQVRRAKWKQRHTWLMGSMEGKEAVAAFRSLPKSTLVKVNVGGIRFKSNLGKMRRYRGSYLEIMFGTRYRVPQLRVGEYFFDRDPSNFKQILNLLEDPEGAQKLANISHNQPSTNLENDIAYFLKPRTKCEHIDIIPVDIETNRKDVVAVIEEVHDSSQSHLQAGNFTYNAKYPIDELTRGFIDIANNMIHQIYSRYLKQSKYIDDLEASLVEEETRLDHMETFLRSAERSFNTEYGLVEYYIQCMTDIVELQFGEKSTFRVLTCKPTLTQIRSSVLDEMFNEKSEKKKEPVSDEYYRAPRYILKESEPHIFLSILNYLRQWYPEPPSLASISPEDRVRVWAKAREYKVYTRSWLKLLPCLKADEQWHLHWKDIVLDGDDSVFTE